MQMPCCQIMNPDGGGTPGGGLTPGQEADARLGLWPFRISMESPTLLGVDTLGGDGVVPNGADPGTIVTSPQGDAETADISTQQTMNYLGMPTGSTVSSFVDTRFFVYWCASGPFAGGLGFSDTAPTRDADNGLYVLGSGADEKQALFIGMIRTDPAGNLLDTVKSRHVVNYWNRRATRLQVVPNYNNNNTATTYARSSANWTTMAATQVASQCSYISNGEDCSFWGATLVIVQGDPLGSVDLGIGVNTTTTPLVSASILNLTATFPSCSCQVAIDPDTLGAVLEPTMLVRMDSVVPGWAIVADQGRFGAAADVPATFMHGWIMA